MKVRELREGLDLLSKLLSSWQARTAAGDLDRLAHLFEQHADLSVTEFCSAVEKALSQGAQGSPKQKSQDDELVQRWLQDLRQSESSPALFESLLPKIEKMRNADLFALATAYSGIEGGYRKKGDAIKAIREKRAADASVQRQLKGVSGIF